MRLGEPVKEVRKLVENARKSLEYSRIYKNLLEQYINYCSSTPAKQSA